MIEPPSPARHSGPPSATGWMTGAHLPAGTQSANRRPTTTSPMNNSAPTHLPDSARRVKRHHRRRSTLPANQALDPARPRPATPQRTPGRSPETPLPTERSATVPPPTQPNVKNGQPPLDITRPFMDDKRLAISGSAPFRGRSRKPRCRRLARFRCPDGPGRRDRACPISAAWASGFGAADVTAPHHQQQCRVRRRDCCSRTCSPARSWLAVPNHRGLIARLDLGISRLFSRGATQKRRCRRRTACAAGDLSAAGLVSPQRRSAGVERLARAAAAPG